MNSPYLKINPEGKLLLDNEPFHLYTVVYFGRSPGTCIGNWLDDEHYKFNKRFFDYDFEIMKSLGINTVTIYWYGGKQFIKGKPNEKVWERLDEIIEKIKKLDLRVLLYTCRINPGLKDPYLDLVTPYEDVMGEPLSVDEKAKCLHPAVNESIFQAYFKTAEFAAKRYASEPAVVGHFNPIPRLVFTGRVIPGLKELWHNWLEQKYKNFKNLVNTYGKLSENPKSFQEVKLPQEVENGFSLCDPRSYDYVLMQQRVVGKSMHRFQEELKKAAPNQLVVTSLEGCEWENAEILSYWPVEKKLECLWIEQYNWCGVRSSQSGETSSDTHYPRFSTRKDAIETVSPSTFPYLFIRWVKETQKVPVIICHGVNLNPWYGTPTEYDQMVLFDRFNRTSIEAGINGIAYWCWMDDKTSFTAYPGRRDRRRNRLISPGETMGIVRYDGSLRPVSEVVKVYSKVEPTILNSYQNLKRETLLLIPIGRAVTLHRHQTLLTAISVLNPLLRIGILPEIKFTSDDDKPISMNKLTPYSLVILADSEYFRDDPKVPDELKKYVEKGGVLFLPVHHPEKMEDNFGKTISSKSLFKLCGEPILDEKEPFVEGRVVNWFITDEFATGLHFVSGEFSIGASEDSEAKITRIIKLPQKARVISMLKFPDGNFPFLYYHPLGKGWVFCFTGSLNVFRSYYDRFDFGHDDFDWLFYKSLEIAGIKHNLVSSLRTFIREMTFPSSRLNRTEDWK